MSGYSYEEKEALKREVDVTELLKELCPNDFIYREKGIMVTKDLSKRHLIIYPADAKYPSHGFINRKERRCDDWKDNITVIEMIFDCGFMKACDILSDYLTRKQEKSIEPDIPHFNLFDNL